MLGIILDSILSPDKQVRLQECFPNAYILYMQN